MIPETKAGPLRIAAWRQPMLHRIFRAEPRTVRKALGFMRERFDGSAGDEVIFRLELALAEVLNNICQHGARPEAERLGGHSHSPIVNLCVIRHVGGIACAVTDDGTPLPNHCLAPRALPGRLAARAPDGPGTDLPEGGFGWFLIQDLTASLSYFREGRRNFLAFIVPVGDHAARHRPVDMPIGRSEGDQFRPNCSG